MNQEIIMAGMGGQGVMVIGQLLAHAALLEDLELVWFPSYGAETRGGAAICTITISDRQIGSPISTSPDYLIALTQAMLDRHVDIVKPGASMLINSSLVQTPKQRPDCKIVEIAANELAEQAGNKMGANMVMLGSFVGLASPVKLDSIKQAMSEVLPERHHRFIPLNSVCLDIGHSLTSEAPV